MCPLCYISHPSREEDSDSDDGFVNISTALPDTSHTDSLKLPIQILDHRIRTFTQTTVPHDLGRLRRHRENIAKLHGDGNWTKLDSEQINANRTVQVCISLSITVYYLLLSTQLVY